MCNVFLDNVHQADAINSLPDDKILYLSKLNVLADDNFNVLKWCIFLSQGRKHCGKWRKCWFPAFSSFPKMFSKGFFSRVVNLGIVWERVNTLFAKTWPNCICTEKWLFQELMKIIVTYLLFLPFSIALTIFMWDRSQLVCKKELSVTYLQQKVQKKMDSCTGYGDVTQRRKTSDKESTSNQ